MSPCLVVVVGAVVDVVAVRLLEVYQQSILFLMEMEVYDYEVPYTTSKNQNVCVEDNGWVAE